MVQDLGLLSRPGQVDHTRFEPVDVKIRPKHDTRIAHALGVIGIRNGDGVRKQLDTDVMEIPILVRYRVPFYKGHVQRNASLGLRFNDHPPSRLWIFHDQHLIIRTSVGFRCDQIGIRHLDQQLPIGQEVLFSLSDQ